MPWAKADDYPHCSPKFAMKEPFFFAQDDDTHWYMVPERIRVQWDVWRNLPEPHSDASDEAWGRYWTEPEDAVRCDMHPQNYTVRLV